MVATIAWAAFLLAGQPATQLQPDLGREMTAIIVAINKALGLESWTSEGEEPCVDRGGLEATAKNVDAQDARACAGSAIEKGFPDLGKEYFVGILMADIGPVTVFAVGQDHAAGWGAYSCDPARKCPPTRLTAGSKPARRLADRYRRACQDARTLWFPSREGACPEVAITPAAEPRNPAPLPAGAKPRPASADSP
jgi:hypothetical protein